MAFNPTSNVGKDSIVGYSSGAEVVLKPLTQPTSGATLKKSWEFLPTSLPFSSTSRCKIPMAVMNRPGVCYTNKGAWLQFNYGYANNLIPATATADDVDGITCSLFQRGLIQSRKPIFFI